jgi:polyisoprenoid-binding protein YceI
MTSQGCARAAWQWLLVIAAAPLPAAETYRIDAPQSRVEILARRFGIVWLRADFREVGGEFVLDRTGSQSRVEVTVAANAVETPDRRWTARLRSTEWLDTQRYPQIVFRAGPARIALADSARVSGRLTVRGVTRPETLIVDQLDCLSAGVPSAGHCLFSAHTRILRSDFDLPHGFWLAGDEVEIAVSGSARRVNPK